MVLRSLVRRWQPHAPVRTAAINMVEGHRTLHSSFRIQHENPLGLPRRPGPPPTIPRRGTQPIQKRPIPHVKKVVAVASGKGGVGKSTVAVNLAVSLALNRANGGSPLRVGILDLDIFGPSIPGLMGLERAEEPRVTDAGALIPLMNHGLRCMSMGFLLPPLDLSVRSESSEPPAADTAVVWRGLMVQKAVQQLLFDVDWRLGAEQGGAPLDVLVLDLPPGTGDVPLTLGQLVQVDSAVIVSTPQNVSLYDVRRGIAMFRKLTIPITGLVLNQSHFFCPSCSTPHNIYGDTSTFHDTAQTLGIDILGQLPVLPQVSSSGNRGVPLLLENVQDAEKGVHEWQGIMHDIALRVLGDLQVGR